MNNDLDGQLCTEKKEFSRKVEMKFKTLCFITEMFLTEEKGKCSMSGVSCIMNARQAACANLRLMNFRDCPASLRDSALEPRQKVRRAFADYEGVINMRIFAD